MTHAFKGLVLALALAWVLQWFDASEDMLAFFNTALTPGQQASARVFTEVLGTVIIRDIPLACKPCVFFENRYGVMYSEGRVPGLGFREER